MIYRRQLQWWRFWWVCDWLITMGVIYGSLTPNSTLPDTVSFFNDKALHFGAYFLMAFWFAGSLERRHYPGIAFGLVLLGAGIEVVQYLMGFGREADWRDFLANASGIALALSLAYAGFGNWMAWIERRLGAAKTA